MLPRRVRRPFTIAARWKLLSDTGQSSSGVDKKSEAESGRVYLVKDLGAALHGRGVAVTQGMRLLLSVWTMRNGEPAGIHVSELPINANDSGRDRVCFRESASENRVFNMTGEYPAIAADIIDGDINVAARNFSTELQQRRLRSSVRRISFPSQTAEVLS